MGRRRSPRGESAAELVTYVTHEQGYPVDGADDCSDYVAIDCSELATGYRTARVISQR